jgi:hypothetical protein
MGYEYPELCAFDEPFNGKENCVSFHNASAFQIPQDGDKNMLTN